MPVARVTELRLSRPSSTLLGLGRLDVLVATEDRSQYRGSVLAGAVAEEHPRPQLRRAGWIGLSGEWEFGADDAGAGLREHWERGISALGGRIVVPYPPESPSSMVDEPSGHRVLWYRRRWLADPPPPGQRLLLHFDAVEYAATVWVNGHQVAGHEGGHTPFTADVTDALDGGGSHLTAVQVVDDRTDATQPRGKQDWREPPHAVWYHRTSGIWQLVWAESVPNLHIGSLTRVPDPAALGQTLRGGGPGRRRVLRDDGDERGQPPVLSEFGGLSRPPDAGQDWFGYGVVHGADDLAARLAVLFTAGLDCDGVAGFCYTQLTDTMQERNGLLTEDREPKVSVTRLREMITRPNRAIPTETVDAHRRRDRATATVPTAASESP